jgi:hypothetical protein
MGMQSFAGHHSLHRTLNECNASTGRFPLILEPGIGRAVGEAVAAFYAAVGLGEDLFGIHDKETEAVF